MSSWHYRPGDWNVIDDLSGFKLKHSQTRTIPGGQTGGSVVARSRWEPQHPQDFVRGIVDDQTVRQPRPRQPNRFTITATFVTAYSPPRTRFLQVDSLDGFSVLDRVAIMLDVGENFYATIIRLFGNQMEVTPVLPWSVGGPYSTAGQGNYGTPIENTVIDMGPSNFPPFLTDDFGVPITDEDGNLFSTSQ